jgi:peptidase MA superfamily protein
LRRLTSLLLALIFITLLVPASALAQEAKWNERRTDRFAILYADGDEQTAAQYAGFVDAIYDEVAAIFGHRTGTPVTLRLYPSVERYYEVNPLARGLPGIVAHADFRRHEVVVIIPQTASQTPDEIQNNIRHELTHIVAAELSDDRLNTGLQEGVAQYVEHPSRELETKIQLLRSHVNNDRLLSWSQIDDRDTVYQNPEVSYPESLSIVAFLIERYSFAKLRDFLTISARSSGYRSALERAFGVTPDDLEEQWRAWLPQYLAGGYRRNVLTAYDLSRAEDLLRQGRYAETKAELEDAINWLQMTNQAAVLQEAQALLERSNAGQAAEALANEARAALEAADYARAAETVAKARQSYATLGDTRQDAVLSAYAERAERGQRAIATLDQATSLAQQLRYPQARAVADQAAAEFARLGDRGRADQALTLRAALDQRQSLLGTGLLILGLGGVVASAVRRLTVREAEAW